MVVTGGSTRAVAGGSGAGRGALVVAGRVAGGAGPTAGVRNATTTLSLGTDDYGIDRNLTIHLELVISRKEVVILALGSSADTVARRMKEARMAIMFCDLTDQAGAF